MRAVNASALLTAWEQGVPQTPLRRALMLLAVGWPERSVDEWAQATIGDRDRRLILLREHLFGSRLETLTACPQCGERLELAFDIQDILVPLPDSSAEIEDNLRLQVSGYDISCRLPTSRDLLEVASSVEPNKRGALFRRCIQTVQIGGEVISAEALPEDVSSVVIKKMAETDPQAEVEISLECVACSHRWYSPFDIVSYFWNEIEDWAQRLFLEVHALASAYGWSEQEILSMSPQRRQLYVGMLGA